MKRQSTKLLQKCNWRAVLTIAAACFLTSCSVRKWADLERIPPTDVLRQNSRHVYTMNVPGDYLDVHDRIVAAMHNVGWGEYVQIRDEKRPELSRASTWACYPEERTPHGFLIDTERLGDDTAKITVYPYSKWYARKSREMIEEALDLRER